MHQYLQQEFTIGEESELLNKHYHAVQKVQQCSVFSITMHT